MTPAVTHPLVAAYLRDLELLLHGVEPGERAEVLAGFHEHLDASLAPGASDDDVRRSLAELGSPQSVADEAYAGRPASASTPSLRTSSWPPITATAINAACLLLIMTLVAFSAGQASAIAFSFVIFLLPWTGVCALTVVTGRWGGLDKLISVLIVPGALAAHAAVVAIVMSTIGSTPFNLAPPLAITAVALWWLVKLSKRARA